MKQLSDVTRVSICRKYDNGRSPSIIATELELNSKTVTSLIQMYKKTGRVEAKKKRQPKNKKITPEATEFIKKDN